jgi:hypothetical protein
MTDGVTVAQQILVLFVKVRILVGQLSKVPVKAGILTFWSALF